MESTNTNKKIEALKMLPSQLIIAAFEKKTVITSELQTAQIEVGESASLTLVSITENGSDVPIEIDITLKRGASINWIVRSVCRGESRVKIIMRSHHKGEETKARYDIRAIASDDALFESEGIIIVPPSGVRADARYEQHILNASHKAHLKTTPSLEIEPSEVKISHATSVQSWDEEALLYSESRGLNPEEAKEVIARAFLMTGLEYIEDAESREIAENEVEKIIKLQKKIKQYMKDIISIKEKFPILNKKVNGHPLAYLDNAATTQKPSSMINALTRYYENDNANIHRGMHTLAERATEGYEKTRAHVASFINAKKTEEIIFTKNATEAINLVAYTWGEKNINKGDEVIVSALEHHANLVPWQELVKRKEAILKVVPITEGLLFDMPAFEKLLTKKTKLVCVTAMSNVTGTITPIHEIIKKAHEVGAIVLVDGAQSVAHMATNVQEDDMDFLVFSAHKMLGPTGVGVLYGKQELLSGMPPFLFGGNMIEQVAQFEATYKDNYGKFEAGTPNIADVIAFGASLTFLEEVGMEVVAAHDRELLDYAKDRFGSYSFVKLFTPASSSDAGGILSFSIEGVHPHDVATIFDQEGVAIRAGLHCAEPLIRSLGVSATARLSFYLYNTRDDVDAAERALKKVAEIFKIS